MPPPRPIEFLPAGPSALPLFVTWDIQTMNLPMPLHVARFLRARLRAEGQLYHFLACVFASSCKLATLQPPHQIIEIDHELLGPGDVVLELLDVGARELGRWIAGRLGSQLHHRGVL